MKIIYTHFALVLLLVCGCASAPSMQDQQRAEREKSNEMAKDQVESYKQYKTE